MGKSLVKLAFGTVLGMGLFGILGAGPGAVLGCKLAPPPKPLVKPTPSTQKQEIKIGDTKYYQKGEDGRLQEHAPTSSEKFAGAITQAYIKVALELSTEFLKQTNEDIEEKKYIVNYYSEKAKNGALFGALITSMLYPVLRYSTSKKYRKILQEG